MLLACGGGFLPLLQTNSHPSVRCLLQVTWSRGAFLIPTQSGPLLDGLPVALPFLLNTELICKHLPPAGLAVPRGESVPILQYATVLTGEAQEVSREGCVHLGWGSETCVVFSVHGPASSEQLAALGRLVLSPRVPTCELCTDLSTYSDVTTPSHRGTDNVVDGKPYCQLKRNAKLQTCSPGPHTPVISGSPWP